MNVISFVKFQCIIITSTSKIETWGAYQKFLCVLKRLAAVLVCPAVLALGA